MWKVNVIQLVASIFRANPLNWCEGDNQILCEPPWCNTGLLRILHPFTYFINLLMRVSWENLKFYIKDWSFDYSQTLPKSMRHGCLKDVIPETTHLSQDVSLLFFMKISICESPLTIIPILDSFHSGLIKHELLYKMMCHLTPPVGFGKKCPKSVAYKVSTNRRSRCGCSLKKVIFRNIAKFPGKYVLGGFSKDSGDPWNRSIRKLNSFSRRRNRLKKKKQIFLY